jgi:hypothetical protein
LENIHFEDRKEDERAKLRYILENKMGYKVDENGLGSGQRQVLVSVVLNLRVFAARKLIFL